MPSKRQSINLQYDVDNKQVIFPQKDQELVGNSSKKRGIIYARVSTEEQKQKGNGINAQISDCQRWAKAQDEEIEIVWEPFIDEAKTWSSLQRKSFLDAIRFLEQENKKWVKIDYFICGSTSRFSRSHKLNETFDMVARVEMTGAKLVAVWNGGIQETDSEEWLLTMWFNFLIDAVESKRGQKRVRYGQKGKLYEWLRPFPDVPLWYERIVEKIWWKEIKMLIKKEPEASILAEWLRLFSEWIILTKQQLYEFFDERWLKSNSKKNKTGKLHKSIIDKLLDTWKLYVYAWYLTYPDWDIHEFIPAKHPAIIDMDIFHKIMQRLHKNKSIVDHKKRKYDQDVDQYPLKRILLCPECHKWVTKWKSLSKTGDYHHYYWCNTSGCSLYKKSLKREDVHNAVRARLSQITPPLESVKLFEKLFVEERKNAEKDIDFIHKEKKKKITLMQAEMDKIEKIIDDITDPALFKKKQEKRSELNQEKSDIQEQMDSVRFTQDEFEKVYNEAKLVISNPLALWDLQDLEIKQLLIRVCFNNKIYYRKKEWLHTPETSVLYFTLGQLSNIKTSNLDLQQDLLNPIGMDILKFEEEINRFYQFWLMLVRSDNLERYRKYKHLV